MKKCIELHADLMHTLKVALTEYSAVCKAQAQQSREYADTLASLVPHAPNVIAYYREADSCNSMAEQLDEILSIINDTI